MLKLVICLIFGLAADFASADTVIKKCLSTRVFQGQTSITEITIIKKQDARLYADIASIANGEKTVVQTSAGYAAYRVDQKKFKESNENSMNTAEKFIAHAIQLEEDPALENSFSAGIDLRRVAKADVYDFPLDDSLGKQAIIIASDKDTRLLGMFLAGFLIGTCK